MKPKNQQKKLLCIIKDLGLIEYEKAYQIQKLCVEEVLKGNPQSLIICEHPCVVTLGRLAKEENLLIPHQDIEKKKVKILPIDRGGDITLHSPGQLVIYPILNLKNYGMDLKKYLFHLEQVAIDFLRDFDILACRKLQQTGVWVGKDKVASIGIGVKRWISFHGMAINVNTDLDLFSMIRPCGLDVRMTSLNNLKGSPINFRFAKNVFIKKFCQQFHLATSNS